MERDPQGRDGLFQRWKTAYDEKSQAQSFLKEFFDVFGVDMVTQATFELIVPKVSSERRDYIPMGFVDDLVIATDLVFMVPDATLYHFGILTSRMHNAWMRTVVGRPEMRYRYSKDLVYNNFIWPSRFPIRKSTVDLRIGNREGGASRP